ncbi:DNA topoisomerase (ATP-hydrolyzing) subunit B [Candidatus Woesearchaeota archaeon]|nr:DNA topoisomerase (ATP-hydrolyzing) subunit B [Candidatus Woesearchaeota archaeon]
MAEKKYTGTEIQVLEGLEPVRKRPGMYIGSTDARGLHHIVYEVVDNAVDEALAGFCTTIKVDILTDGMISIEDDGRGIPVDIHPKKKVSTLQVVMTVLHAGGKFEQGAYKVSGGLHGVGVSVTNALSSYLKAEVKRDGKLYMQEYIRGTPKEEVKEMGKVEGSGTKITFAADPEVFETTSFKFETLQTRLREMAFLNKGLRIILTDHRTEKKADFQYKGGIQEFVEWINRKKNVLHKPIYYEKERDGIMIECAIQYNDGFQEQLFSFANNINTHEGGTHLTGFKSALTKSLNRYAEKQGMMQKGQRLSSDDFKEGLTAIVSVKVPEPQFEGQTKTKLGNSEVKGIVETISSDQLGIFLQETPGVAKLILKKAIDASKAREAARKAREIVRRKSVFESTTLPGKLTDCSTKDREKSEIFIVEGESAGGTAKQGRDKNYQAILPLKGKIINVEKARLLKVLKNAEVSALITAIGTGIGEEFTIDKRRYNKIVIMTDADVDGNHIACLLLTFFYRYMKELIDSGHIYLAQPPLYKIGKGRKVRYAYTEAEKDKILKEVGEKVSIQRYKGLGEMNAEQLWETTMNPETRTLKLITIEDAVSADEMFSTLMGDQVAPRREFILEHAKEAELDV